MRDGGPKCPFWIWVPFWPVMEFVHLGVWWQGRDHIYWYIRLLRSVFEPGKSRVFFCRECLFWPACGFWTQTRRARPKSPDFDLRVWFWISEAQLHGPKTESKKAPPTVKLEHFYDLGRSIHTKSQIPWRASLYLQTPTEFGSLCENSK